MKQGEKKTLLYIGITMIGLLWCIIMGAALYNTSPKNEAQKVQASLADATLANAQAMHMPHTPASNPAKPSSLTRKDKNRRTSSPHTFYVPNKNQDALFGYRRQGGSYFTQACIVVIVGIVVTIIVFIIKRVNNTDPKRFHNAYGCRKSYDNLLLARAREDYYALLRINATAIGYGRAGDHSLSQVVHKLKAIAKDPRNKGLFIVLYNEKKVSPDDLVIGHCLTLVSAIEAYKRQTQRNVIAYAETFMPKHYLVATGADQIYVAPTGALTICVPVVLQRYTLRNVHAQPLNHKARLEVAKEGNQLVVGKYKLNLCKNDQQDNFKKCYQDPYIERVRKRKVPNMQSVYAAIHNLQRITINSEGAHCTGLVDDCGEKQNIIANLDYPVQKCPVHFRPLSLEEKRALSQQPAIEVVFIAGRIDSRLVTRIAPLFTLLAKAEEVKGLMLVIDSRGGPENAVKAISAMIKRLKAAGKVIFAYTEGYCCSSAYWIACTAHRVFARETALIGSIGGTIEVSEGVFSLIQETLDKYTLQRCMQEFIAHVASCRAESLHASKEDLAKMVLDTEARTFDGQRAKDLQLIDEIGTLDTTIAAMKRTLECPDIKVFYREPPTRRHCN